MGRLAAGNRRRLLLLTEEEKSKLVSIKEPHKSVAEDPDDDLVLATAYEGKARHILSGDGHLLKMKEFRGIEAVTVNRMLELLKGSKG